MIAKLCYNIFEMITSMMVLMSLLNLYFQKSKSFSRRGPRTA